MTTSRPGATAPTPAPGTSNQPVDRTPGPGDRPATSAASLGRALRGTWQTPFLRAALVAMVVQGIAGSLMAPQLSLFLTDELGASLTVAGFYYLTNVSAPFLGWLLGSISDRDGKRLRAFRVASLLTAAGWFVTAAATQVWVPFVAATVLLGFGGAVGGQLFAAVREHLVDTGRPDATQVTAVVRMGMTAGWIIGPMLGALVGDAVNLRLVLVLAGVGALAQVVPLGRRRDTPRPAPVPLPRRRSGSRPDVPARVDAGPLPMLAFTLFCVLALTGNTMKYAYLPIFMDKDLGTSATTFGAVIGAQQTVEFLMMPVCAILASRWGAIRVVMAGALAGVLANLFFATAESVWPLFVGQALIGVMWSAIAALGIVVAQHLWSSRLATASGIFMSAGAVASATGGAIGGLTVDRLGLPQLFFVPVVLCAIAAVGLALLARRHHVD